MYTLKNIEVSQVAAGISAAEVVVDLSGVGVGGFFVLCGKISDAGSRGGQCMILFGTLLIAASIYNLVWPVESF